MTSPSNPHAPHATRLATETTQSTMTHSRQGAKPLDTDSSDDPAHDTHHHYQTPIVTSERLDARDWDTSFIEVLMGGVGQFFDSLKTGYINVTDRLIDEIYITLSQEQVNDALAKFVTANVDMLLNLRMDLHAEWLRLYCTVNVKGIYASVYSDFRLVDVTLTGETQRFVFEQLGETHIIELHAQKWWQVPTAKTALRLYQRLLRHDPLPVLLSKITVKKDPFATHKGRFIYLDIGRYLTKQTKILKTLQKVQINHGETRDRELVLKAQINPAELINFGTSGEDIITEKDNPTKHTDTPKNDASDNDDG